MATIRLRDARGEREVDQADLFARMTAAQADIQGLVQRVEGGPWMSAGAWYLDSSRIQPPVDSAGQRYVQAHAVRGLRTDSLLAFLGVDPAHGSFAGALARSHEAVTMPEWGRDDWGRQHVVDYIEGLPWAPDPGGVIADAITMPWWGAPFALPVVAEIEIPSWRDPSEDGYFALPRLEPVVWRQLAMPEAIAEPPRPKPAPTPKPQPARRISRAPHRRSPKPAHRPPSQRHVPTEPRAAKTAQPTAEQGPVTVTRGWGLFGCVGQLVGLVALLFIVALGADFGLRKAVSSLRGLDIGASVAAHRAAARRDLPPFLVEGPDESWMQVVVAADLSKPGQVRAVGRLLTRLHEAWQADILPHGRAPRLVFLPKLEPGDGSTDLAAAILALSHQTDFWSWLRNVAARGEAVSVANIRASMAAADLDLKRFADDRTDPDAVLRCRTWSTMAAGLGLADAVAAVNGRVTKASDLASDKAADAFIRRAADVAGEARAVHGDDISAAHATLVAHMPERTAQRWLQWIVRGERVPTRPLAEVPAKTAVEVEEAPREAIEPPPGAASMGSPKAPVTVLVFIDFHCPFSQRHAVNYRRLIKDFGGDIRLAIAHFPIKTLHADSKAAATLAISAQAQGMFWPAHDLLFERADDDWDDAAMVRLLAATAKESGMRFRRGRLRTNRKRRAAKVVRAHRKLGKKHGVNGTPYTFINGRPLRGAVPYKKLRALVEDELRQVAVPEPAETP